ncbi:hypothetical protein BGX31_010134 [Mortierella sp. GBA43]|nr:hypothetical protein BGX31_010134 [Mortierella sp. GBA43]
MFSSMSVPVPGSAASLLMLWPWSESVSVIEVPLLVQMICEQLEIEDIGNCSLCCKAWYAIFAPLRFKTLEIDSSLSPGRNAFMLINSHHIRKLKLNLGSLDTFNSSCCINLWDLELVFKYELGKGKAGMEDDDFFGGKDEEEEDWMELLNFDTSLDLDQDDLDLDLDDDNNNKVKLNQDVLDPYDDGEQGLNMSVQNQLVCAAHMVQHNKSLRSISLIHGWDDFEEKRPLSLGILQAIEKHSFLRRIKIGIQITCLTFAKLLNHLPEQVQELEMTTCIKEYRAGQGQGQGHGGIGYQVDEHPACDNEGHILMFRNKVLGLVRVEFFGQMRCLVERMLIPFLRCCPHLEELTLPEIVTWNTDRFQLSELTRVLNTYCPRLHTLHQGMSNNHFPCPRFEFHHQSEGHMSVIIQGVSYGFRHLTLLGLCPEEVHLLEAEEEEEEEEEEEGGSAGEQGQQCSILESLLVSSTLYTLQEFAFYPASESDYLVLGVLKLCPRLKSFRVFSGLGKYDGVDISHLIALLGQQDAPLSGQEPWRCKDTLEHLELEIHNWSFAKGLSATRTLRSQTTQEVRQLCMHLRSFSKLTYLNLRWNLKTKIQGCRGDNPINLTLANLNAGGARNGLPLMTLNDIKWMRLQRFTRS